MIEHSAIAQAAQASYGRLIAFLAARSHDLASAEDALADAFVAALERWPVEGVPSRPEAWLLTTARRRLIDQARHQEVVAEAAMALQRLAEEAEERANRADAFPDERLTLLFVCAHPAIDQAARTPLMLQTILGLDAARIAAAFVVQPAAMGQRLSRAKAKIRDARIAFELPAPEALAARLDCVLDAIYAAYGSGWEDVLGVDLRRKDLAADALQLGQMLIELLPGQPEALGLVALMLFCESRHGARRSAQGAFVPLSQQDPGRWSPPLIAQANQILSEAATHGRMGRFQLEAAIQAVHAHRAHSGATDWEAIALLYEGLVRHGPSLGALVGRAAAVAQVRGADAGWALLHGLPAARIATFQPYWACAAHLAVQRGRRAEAADYYERAIDLSPDPAQRAFLEARARENAAASRPPGPDPGTAPTHRPSGQ